MRSVSEMNGKEAFLTSKNKEWETPNPLFDSLNEEFHFTMDVCASSENAKCARYFTKEQDALKQEWTGVCWCNPPFSKGLGKWVKKAYESDALTVMLIPARTDTIWFHEYILNKNGVEVRFIKGRIKFVGAEHKAPFPCMVVIFNRGGSNA